MSDEAKLSEWVKPNGNTVNLNGFEATVKHARGLGLKTKAEAEAEAKAKPKDK